MKRRLVAVGIDAPNGGQFNDWLESGLLPNLRGIITRGTQGSVNHLKQFRNERCWDLFLSRRHSASSGSVFNPSTYGYFNESLQRVEGNIPFYALGNARKVGVFDLPTAISDKVDGIQVSGWGSELNASLPQSSPPDLIGDLQRRFGRDPKLADCLPVLDPETGEQELSWVLPSLYDQAGLAVFAGRLRKSVERRTAIIMDLLSRDSWDLFLCLYPETHTANHCLWHAGEPHPLSAIAPPGHPQLDILTGIDSAVGRIAGKLAPDTAIMFFTIDQTAANTADVTGMALLPELFYRWCFPGRVALAHGNINAAVPPARTDYRRHWKHEVWSLVTAEGRGVLAPPTQLETEGDALNWNAANWYRPLWPRMKAFALPSVGDGYVRVNVAGREAGGMVEPTSYEATMTEIEALLFRAVNPRTRRPLVENVVRTRGTPFERAEIPPDLVVCWSGEPADCLDSPDVGRIGPLPYFRSGGHVPHGTVIENRFAVCGPGIPSGSELPPRHLGDMGDTILDLIGGREG